MRVVDIEEMRNIESEAMESFGFTEDLVLENIGLRGADFIQEEILVEREYEEIVFLIGEGNNGADGLAVARNLCNRGYACRAFMLFDESGSSAGLKKQKELCEKFGVKFTDLSGTDQLSAYFTQTQDEYLVVDAILGIGFRSPLSNYLFDIVKLVNEYSSITISMDIATGVEANSGAIDSEAIIADFTLAIGLPKTGLYVGEGAKHSGEIAVLDCGFPMETMDGGDKALLLIENLSHIYSGRSKFSHKNSFGHSLIVGGSVGLTGALIMASEAALRVGTGLVTAATWKESYEEATSRMTPEVMTGLIPTERDDVEDIIRLLERYDSIVIGPGLGRTEKTRSTVVELLSNFAGPVTVDADGINALSLKEDAQLLKSRKGATILTPHIGEFASFMGISNAEVLENPLGLLKKAVEKTNSCIILKGACSFLAFPTGEVLINYFPNDGLATGGSGDVLSGMLGGLLAQAAPDKADKKKSSLFTNDTNYNQAMCLGVALHTLAGKHAAKKNGTEAMSARDIIKNLSEAFREISNPLL
jgi:hydroxyethylthiazole kinase-like uncharacterized protein yjeF